MATKTEMISFILENSNEFSADELDELKYNEVKSLLKEVENDIENKEEVIEEEDEDFSNLSLENLEKVSSENYGDDGVGLTDEQISDLMFDDEPEPEEEEWDYDKLSPVDKRRYRRTGIKRITKIKKYSRFGDEKPKI